MTAVPSKGNLFIGWTGLGSNVSTAKVTFKMFTNLVLTANFVTNRFPAVVGTYNGLFCRTNDGTNLVSPESAGFFTMQTTSAGGYSGNILVAGNKVTLSGTFDYTGHATNSVKLAGYAAPFTLNLYLDLTNNTGEVYGSLSNATWNTSVLGYRGVSSLGTNTTPAAGKYTLTVPGAGAYTNSGTATIVVAKTGSITLSGKLADQSALSQTVVVSKDGWWPIYGSYTKGSGLLWGWVKSEQKTTTGVLRWIKPSTSGNSAIAADVGVTGR
jgi:hypothetical protein